MVPKGGRHATSDVQILGKAALWAVFVVGGARGDCASPDTRSFHAGRRLGRSASTISRELRRNAATRSGGLEYRATTAQWHVERSARRPKPTKLALNATLRTYVKERLAGIVVAPSGIPVTGPAVSWKNRRDGQRQNRRWARAWSPEQIARRLPIDFPNDETMRISHEAIYQALFVQGRGALRRETDGLLANRTGVAGAEGASTQPRQRLCLAGDHDQQASGRSRRSGGARTLGRRPHPGPWQLGDRHARRAHDALHDATAPSAPCGSR
jgi:hypothetical protein